MIQRAGLWVIAFLFLGLSGWAQSDAGKLRGKVTDENDEAVPYATVKIIQNGLIKGGANTDGDGNYSIYPITPGTYNVVASFAGQEKTIENLRIVVGKTKTLNIKMSTDVELGPVEIYEPIEFDQTTSIESFDKTQIRETGYRDIKSIAAIAAGAVPAERGQSINMRGQRSSGTTYFVDGVKMRGVISLPQKSIEQISVITGGTPAEYGDMIGGVISITTAGPSYQLTGGAEVLTSQFLPDPYIGLDPFGYTLIGLNASGPIITKYDSAMDYRKPILGFMIAGEAEFKTDEDPAHGGINALTDGRLDFYEQNPLQLDETGNFFVQTANFLQEDEVEKVKVKENSQDERYRISGRLDFQPNDNIVVKLGITWEDITSDQWSLRNSLFAPSGNNLFEGYLFRGWMRFQQKFQGGEDSKLKNMFYMLQADYNVYHREFSHKTHGTNYFDYGHIGEFSFDRDEVYRYVDPSDPNHLKSISDDGYYITSAFAPSNLKFNSAKSKNPKLANYDDFIFDHVSENGIINPFTGRRDESITSMDFLRFFGGLRNGDSPASIYSLYSAPGAATGSYFKFNYEQYRVTGQAAGEIGSHNFKLGFEFEQRIEKRFALSARPLWGYMRLLTNRHLANINENPSSWNLVTVDSIFQDTVHAPIVYSETEQSDFDRNLRIALGKPVNGTEFLIVDQLDPSTFSLDMFSADELLNDGNSYSSYYGYSYTGGDQKRVADEDFFTNPLRPQNAFAPTYIAGFIQDKFELEDIIFNIGVRVDRFDANQKVIKDAFSLYPTFTAQEAAEQFTGGDLPASVDGSFVPYMDNATNPTSIVGYRDPETDFWYDANGAPASSASLRQGGEVQPYVKSEEVTIESFKDYDPQTVVMPRLSFSFPISGEAVFFAHYDVLAQRPGQTAPWQGSLLAGRISDYYFLQNNATVQVTNPNLKPEKTIDYEVGFKQRVNDFMALSISAFYREMRDMIQSFAFTDAYPISYTSYRNLDFGTVKGMSIALNMLRKKNLRFNMSYTMQFANGTGSSFGSSRNALNSVEGFSAIRTLLPLDFDQRHRFSGNFDYRYFGDDNKGPGIKIGEKTFYPLKNMGLNTTFYMSSGTPYSVNSLPDPAQVQGGINSNIQLDGTPNGSRLPWQFRIDMRVDKDFMLGGGIKKDKTGETVMDSYGTAVKKREYAINVYVLLLNALNTKNTLNVYKTSGLPDDDGYLQTGVGEQAVAAAIDPNSFSYMYSIRMQNPGNFSLPRRIRLGVQVSF